MDKNKPPGPAATMDPRAVLDAAIDAARLASPLVDYGDRQFAFVPDGYSLKDISDPYRLSPRVRQQVTLDDRASLTAFVNRFSTLDTVLIADFDALTIRAQIDFHGMPLNNDAPQANPCDFRADLVLRKSEEFLRWDKMEGELHGQAEFGEFLEENAVDIVQPEPAVMIEISRDLEATQGVNFKSANRPESGDRAFTYETETRVKGELKVPREFSIAIPIYQGEQPEVLRARFRFRVTGSGLLLGFVWHRVEYLRQAHFANIATQVSEDTGRPVFYGRAPAPGGSLR